MSMPSLSPLPSPLPFPQQPQWHINATITAATVLMQQWQCDNGWQCDDNDNRDNNMLPSPSHSLLTMAVHHPLPQHYNNNALPSSSPSFVVDDDNVSFSPSTPQCSIGNNNGSDMSPSPLNMMMIMMHHLHPQPQHDNNDNCASPLLSTLQQWCGWGCCPHPDIM